MRPADFDDRDESLPEELEAQLDRFVARHRADPVSAVLRAANDDLLPPQVQTPVAAGISASPWQQAVVRGAADASEDATIEPDEADRLLARIHRDAAAHDVARRLASRRRMVMGVAGLAAAAVFFVTTVAVRRAMWPVLPVEPSTVETVQTAPPTYRIPLEPAPVKLTARALVLRNDAQQLPFVDDASPAFDAYRDNNYGTAAEEFERLAARYPSSVEVPFYLGVSRLMAGDVAGAATALRQARAIGDVTFTDDVAWYLAIANERTGDAGAARTALSILCQGTSPWAARACATAAAFPEP